MKKAIQTAFLLTVALMSCLCAWAQPQGFQYQGVARDAGGAILANESLTLRFVIREGSAAGPNVFEETHTPSTNEFGLFAVVIGEGVLVSGSFDLEWLSDQYFLEVQINGATIPATALSAVPYAKVATDMRLEHLGDVSTSAPANGQVLKWNGTVWTPSADIEGGSSQWTTAGSDVHFNTGNVGIGDATPAATLTVGNGDKFQVQGATGTTIYTDPNASIRFPATSAANNPMVYQFGAGTQNANRMVLAHSPNFSDWGLEYRDTIDVYNFLASGVPILSVNLGNQRVGIGKETPNGKLHVSGNSSTNFPTLLVEETDVNDYARIQLQNASGSSNWQIAALNSVTSGSARLNLFHSSAGNILSLTDGKRAGFGTLNPSHDIHLVHSNGAGSNNTSQGLKIQNEGTNNHSWTLYTVNNGGELWIYSGVSNVGRFAVTGAYTVISDERLKTAIQPMSSTLNKVLELEPMTYRYTHQDANAKNSLGFLAQSAAPLFPELVNLSSGDGNEANYTMDYAGFSVVAIKAIQEQQERISDLEAQVQAQQSENEALLLRLEKLERLLIKE